jgi:hypothetical protein
VIGKLAVLLRYDGSLSDSSALLAGKIPKPLAASTTDPPTLKMKFSTLVVLISATVALASPAAVYLPALTLLATEN